MKLPEPFYTICKSCAKDGYGGCLGLGWPEYSKGSVNLYTADQVAEMVDKLTKGVSTIENELDAVATVGAMSSFAAALRGGDTNDR